MANMNNPFTTQKADLGTEGLYGTFGSIQEQVSNDLLHEVYSPNPKCTRCGGIPAYKIIPKFPHLVTAELQKGVYICSHCLNLGALDSNQYGIRDINS